MFILEKIQIVSSIMVPVPIRSKPSHNRPDISKVEFIMFGKELDITKLIIIIIIHRVTKSRGASSACASSVPK